jgi:hypothetical protein
VRACAPRAHAHAGPHVRRLSPTQQHVHSIAHRAACPVSAPGSHGLACPSLAHASSACADEQPTAGTDGATSGAYGLTAGPARRHKRSHIPCRCRCYRGAIPGDFHAGGGREGAAGAPAGW